jgi:RNA polymerase sigma-70 factor (ECF subfamily)
MAIVLRSEIRFEISPIDRAAATPSEEVDYREFVFRLALAICGERDGAEDVAQDVILTLFHQRKKLASVDNPHAWIRRVTVRSATRYLKRKRATEPLSDAILSQGSASDTFAVYEVLRKLEPEQRAILGMALNQGLCYREIGEALGVPEGTVASRLSAAKKAFQRRWEE